MASVLGHSRMTSDDCSARHLSHCPDHNHYIEVNLFFESHHMQNDEDMYEAQLTSFGRPNFCCVTLGCTLQIRNICSAHSLAPHTGSCRRYLGCEKTQGSWPDTGSSTSCHYTCCPSLLKGNQLPCYFGSIWYGEIVYMVPITISSQANPGGCVSRWDSSCFPAKILLQCRVFESDAEIVLPVAAVEGKFRIWTLRCARRQHRNAAKAI